MDKIRKFVSEFGNTSSSLLLITAVILNQSNEKLLEGDFVRLLVVCCFVLPILFLGIRGLFEVRHAVNKKVIRDDLQESSVKSGQDLRMGILPTDKALRAAYELLKEETMEWSKDAVITDFKYDAQITKKGLKIWSYDLSYSSAWKGVHGHKKISSLEAMNGYSAHFQATEPFADQSQQPFYERYPKWRKAALMAIDKVIDEIDQSYAIYINTDSLQNSQMSIRISYDRRRVAMTRDFYYDGKELMARFDNTKFKI